MYDCCGFCVQHSSCNNPRGKLSGKLWNTDLGVYVRRALGNSLFVLNTFKHFKDSRQ